MKEVWREGGGIRVALFLFKKVSLSFKEEHPKMKVPIIYLPSCMSFFLQINTNGDLNKNNPCRT